MNEQMTEHACRQIIAVTDEALLRTLAVIVLELRRAQGLFPVWPTDAIHAAAVLAEESGEVTKAAIDMTYKQSDAPKQVHREHLYEEASHAGAMAIRVMLGIDDYYAPNKPECTALLRNQLEIAERALKTIDEAGGINNPTPGRIPLRASGSWCAEHAHTALQNITHMTNCARTGHYMTRRSA